MMDFAEQLQEDENYKSLLKIWEKATKLRPWLQNKKNQILELHPSKQPDEAYDEILDSVMYKAQFLLTLEYEEEGYDFEKSATFAEEILISDATVDEIR